MADTLIRVAPFYYIHVLDKNTNTQRVEVGPMTFTRQDHEKVVLGPSKMVVIPPRHYCTVKDPYIRKNEQTKEPEMDKFNQIMLRHGDEEIRFAEDWPVPFPLLPGEKISGAVSPLAIIEQDCALRLAAKRDFSADGVKHVAGDEWLFVGPGTYAPRIEVRVAETISSTIIAPDSALKLIARKAFVDRNGQPRKAGEEWLIREPGAYMPDVDEQVSAVVQPHFLKQTVALHLRAADTFTDVYNITRKAGEEWLVTHKMAELHLQNVHEEVMGEVLMTVLTCEQWCIVLDPVGSDGKNQYGIRQLRKGECSFFLQPGEKLEAPGIQPIYVLGQEEALLLRAQEKFVDEFEGKQVERTPGDRWMIHGPCDYVPVVEVAVVEKRRAIPLDENEGIYVRDTKTGHVRAVTGQTYMLKAQEELWQKDLPEEVEELLSWNYFQDENERRNRKARDKTRVVSFRVPHNAAVQIYDYKAKKSRCVFGPGMVMLDPDEQFTVLSLSGDKPKRPNVIKTLALMLGPDFMTDVVEVETSDHARLRLQLSYNWHFVKESVKDKESEEKFSQAIFQVRDFVGDACKAIASRVRGAVASSAFDQFHKNSAHLIRSAVFGKTEDGKVRDFFFFSQNQLAITNIDIQSVEPVDERTRESLMKSVQLAIEITTRKQERNARHDAEAIEQDAKGKIERQRIDNQKGVENINKELIELQSRSKTIEVKGAVQAESDARAVVLELKGDVEVKQAKLAAEASDIEAMAALQDTKVTQELELLHKRKLAELELTKATKLAEIESDKFGQLVASISPETLKAIAQAGPEMQAKLLKGLGLKGYLMTDGNSPINLFNAAKGMVGTGIPGVGGN